MNKTAYADIIRNHLEALFQGDTVTFAAYPGITTSSEGFELTAFGRSCRLTPGGIFLDGQPDWGPRAIIIGLLARHAMPEAGIASPWRAFRELPNSAPYVGAFRVHSEQILVPRIPELFEQRVDIIARLKGRSPADDGPGDWSVVLDPLPKISLCYHFYLPDEDFPANATCLYSNNADRFLPTDALADVGEYMSQALLELLV